MVKRFDTRSIPFYAVAVVVGFETADIACGEVGAEQIVECCYVLGIAVKQFQKNRPGKISETYGIFLVDKLCFLFIDGQGGRQFSPVAIGKGVFEDAQVFVSSRTVAAN